MTHDEYMEIAKVIQKASKWSVNSWEGIVMIAASAKEDRILKLFNGDSDVLVPTLINLLINIIEGLPTKDRLIAKQFIIEAAEAIEGGEIDETPATPQETEKIARPN